MNQEVCSGMEDVKLRIRADFPGGNIKIVSNDGSLVRLEQDLRDTTEWWFYWHFAAESDAGGEAVFEFMNGEVVGPWGPAVSKDMLHWHWLGKEDCIDRHSFRYAFRAGETVHFAFSLPYQAADLARFLARQDKSGAICRLELTVSEKGRSVPLLLLGNTRAGRHIMMTCRHHACESTASYVLEGILTALLRDKAARFLDRYLVHVVPFVDLDGVEDGDQGKSRAPHDHNRDYTEEPIYRSTAAIISHAGRYAFTASVDLHSPYKWGERHDYTYFVKPDPPFKKEIERFASMLAAATGRHGAGRIKYDGKHDIEMGCEWNQPDSPTFSSFFRRLGVRLPCGFEVPYFGLGDQVYTQENLRLFGEDFAQALMEYLEGT